MLVAIRGCGELLGFLVATSRSDGPWPRAVAARAARTLALVMMVSGDALAERDHRRAELFDDLLAGTDLDRLGARAVALGHDLARPHRAFAFAVDAPHAGDPATSRALAELAAQRSARWRRRGSRPVWSAGRRKAASWCSCPVRRAATLSPTRTGSPRP